VDEVRQSLAVRALYLEDIVPPQPPAPEAPARA
jgi:hypothetical protein